MARYVLIAGVNGAGKSTLYHSLGDIQDLPRVNMDEIVRLYGDWKNPADVMKAGKMAVRQIKSYLNSGVSFNQETTLCGNAIFSNINIAKESGYNVELHYIGLETVELAKERVRMRVLAGGHGISDEDIERRYKESILNARKILSICDSATFYDNSEQFKYVALFKNGILARKSSNLPKWFEKYFVNT